MERSCELELELRLAGPYDVANERGSRAEAATLSEQTQCEHLTIMYKGEVYIYENVSEVQARAVMLIAGSGERLPPWLSGVSTIKELSLTKSLPAPRLKTCEGAVLFVPIERCNDATLAPTMKRSLQRFLQKRKLRMHNSSASLY